MSDSSEDDYSTESEVTNLDETNPDQYDLSSEVPFRQLKDWSSPTEQKSIKSGISLENAINMIEKDQDESHPSIMKWLHLPKNFTFGRSMGNNTRNQEEVYALSDLESSPQARNLAFNAKPPLEPTKSIMNIANKLIRGKSISKDIPRLKNFDDILDDVDLQEFIKDSRAQQNFGLDNEGVTSNLMKLYNQMPDPNEQNSESDDYRSFSGSDLDSHMELRSSSLASKLKNLGHSGMFQGKDHSVGRSRSSNPSNMNDFNLPNFANHSKEDKQAKKIKRKAKKNKATRITVHIVNLIHRQEFLLTLCKAFMIYGAPNHRLEEYMTLTAKVLEVDATFIYLPGMMLVNFSDPVTRTSDLKLVRVGQGLNLNKLDLAHDIFEAVVYDRIGVDEASIQLDNLLNSKEYFSTYWVILFYGISSMFVIVFFSGAWLDMIPSFILGAMLGYLQCIVAPKNEVYSAIFEVGSSILISFVARAVGSIAGGKYFCFSAIVLSGLCMILPGYMILRGALEIQSKSIVSGVVGMFYAIIYSLFLGFGLTLGSALYGWLDKNAIDKTTCVNMGTIHPIWQLLLVPLFNIFMCAACQARYHQLFIMLTIAGCGYVVTYFSALHFKITQFNSALGAFTVGLLSNIYDRWFRGFKMFGHCSTKFTSMICGVFDLVPGGFAARNVLSSGLVLLENSNSTTTANDVNNGSLSFAVTMIEIAIGITVGLFLSTAVVYPLGPKKNQHGGSIGL